MRRTVLVQLKSYGDLVIACAIAQRLEASERAHLGLLVGSHLRELCDAINPPIDQIEIDVGENSVPSIFDLRKNGIVKAMRSAFWLRRQIARAGLGSEDLLLFDRVAGRERFLSGSFETSGLLSAGANIYQSYVERLTAAGLTLSAPAPFDRQRGGPVGIFPGSRIAVKNLPASLVRAIVTTIEHQGLSPKLFLLAGERPDLEQSDLPRAIVPRSFAAMLHAVRSVRAAVTADSMPAHMAEACGVQVFVFSPRANEFWLPQTAFEEQRWDVFDNGVHSARFIDMIAASR